MVSLTSSTSGTEYFDFSNDGTIWSTYPVTGYTVTANIQEFHVAVKGRRYFRIRFENGSSSATTSFKIYTYYGTFSQGKLPLNQSISSDADSIVVRSIATGADPTGTYTNVQVDGYIFTTTSPLTANSSYTSSIYSTSGYTQIQTELYSDQNGTLFGYWYSDSAGTNLIRTFTRPYTTGGTYAYFSSPVFGPYIKYVYTNSTVNQTSFFLGFKFLTKSVSGQVIGLNDFVSNTMVANLGRNVLVGETAGGQFKNVPITAEGHIECSIHGPLLPFGSLHTEIMRPVFQNDPIYGINSGQVYTTSSGTGTSTASDELFVVSTGTTANSYSTLYGRKILRYRPGQGSICRFTALYTSPVANSYQLAGLGNAENGFFFGYGNTNNLSDTSFGILHVYGGKREVRTLTITTGSSTTENITITLNGTAYTVAVTNSANIQRTVWEIFSGTYNGWFTSLSGATVIFCRELDGPANGTYSITGTTVVGSFVQTRAGVASTDTFIPQSSWNGDKMDGSGASGITLNPANGNVYQVSMQYLGFGVVSFMIEAAYSGNNPEWLTVHTLNRPNNYTITTVTDPALPFSLQCISVGSTTNLTVKSASFAGFIEGQKMLHGNRFSYTRSLATIAATPAYQTLFTIMNKRYHKNRINHSVVNILSIQFALRNSNSGGTIYIIRNGNLVGNPNFADYAINSCTMYDTSATSLTISDNSQIIWSGILAETGNLNHLISEEDTEVTIQPGEWISIAGATTAGVAPIFAATINTREDQ